ncbi:hypothetical protein [Robbsia andropogonis]|uniref:hypothetical protein n=1 Tax=Robbsia andropogonis TaxID=28092 RepID=UPI002A6B1473|nr:hypothetical protein [Robbsia andropogonis]
MADRYDDVIARIHGPSGKSVSYDDYAAMEAERDELAKNYDLVKSAGQEWIKRCQDMQSERNALAAQVEALKFKAERYDYLRNEAWGCGKNGRKDVHVCQFGPGVMLSSVTELAEEALDEAIDTARKEQNPIGSNTGHGHVWKRPDGLKAKCGGPGMCAKCSRDAARKEQQP